MKYIVSFPQPQKHLIAVSFVFENNEIFPVKIQLPVWRPGRYELQQYAKNIIEFSVKDAKNNAIKFKNIEPNTWEIYPTEKGEIQVQYLYFAKQLDAGGSWVTTQLIYLNFINFLVYKLDNQDNIETEIKLITPKEYQISCALPIEKSEKYCLIKAENYLELVDSPFLAAEKIQTIDIELNNKHFYLDFWGKITLDEAKIKAHFTAFISEQINFFGNFPEKSYRFQFLIPSFEVYHGVEHRASTVIMLGKDVDFEKEYFYKNLLGISSHELFHTWNICKIRPKNLLPYNLSKPQYFSEGFVAEGVTTYYGDLILIRSGVWNFEDYAKEFALNIKNHLQNPAKNKATFLDIEIGLWVDGYKKTQPFRKISIYDKGAIAAFILDIKIRMHTQNKASLDDVMLDLWQNFGKLNLGYTTKNYIELAEKWCGHSLQKYVDEIIEGAVNTENYLAACFDYLGLELHFYPSQNTLQNHFGIKTDTNFLITDLAISSPGDKHLDIDDKLKSINNQAITKDLLNQFQSDQMIEIEVERCGELLKKRLVRDGSNYFHDISIKQKENRNEEQILNYESWAKSNFRS